MAASELARAPSPGPPESPGLLERHRSGHAKLMELLRRTGAPEPAPVAQLRRCQMCGERLGEIHPHLWEVDARRMMCSCRRCDRRFERTLSQRYRRLRPHVQALPALQLSEGLWQALGGGQELAFFYRVSRTGAVMAGRPGTRATEEAGVDAEAWATLIDRNPALNELESDVEALLVSRLGLEPEHYRISIDHGYRLMGLVVSEWPGLAAGGIVPRAVKEYFTSLRLGSG